MKKAILILALLLTAGAGCGPWRSVGGPYSSYWNNFETELPQGWVRQDTSQYLRITRDGFPLQTIYIGRIRIGDHEFTYTKKRLSKGMLPQEIAEVVLDNMASNPEMKGFLVKENKPVKVGNVPAARLVFEYRTKDGLKIRTATCRFIHEDWFYTITYSAPQRHYYDRDVKEFEKVVARFRLT